MSNNKEIHDIAVIGLGVAGLATTVQAARNGKRVIAFADRPEHIKGQRIVLSAASRMFLNELILDNKADSDFMERLNRGMESPQIKDIERLLFQQLKHYSNVTFVQLDKSMKIETFSQDQHCDCLTLTDGTAYYFHHLVGADGAKHRVSDKVARDLGVDIVYVDTGIQDRHMSHASVSLKLDNSPTSCYTVLTPEEFADIHRQIQEQWRSLGWEEEYAPRSYVFCNEDYSKVTITGEIPCLILSAPEPMKRVLLKEWATLVLQANFMNRWSIMPNPQALSYRQSPNADKNKLMASAFSLETMQQSNAYLYPITNGFYAPIGDARRQPYYKLGHGLNDAIQVGRVFAYYASQPGPFNAQAYHMYMSYIDHLIFNQYYHSYLFECSQPNLLPSVQDTITLSDATSTEDLSSSSSIGSHSPSVDSEEDTPSISDDSSVSSSKTKP